MLKDKMTMWLDWFPGFVDFYKSRRGTMSLESALVKYPKCSTGLIQDSIDGKIISIYHRGGHLTVLTNVHATGRIRFMNISNGKTFGVYFA